MTEPTIGLALSGGGFRASLFHLGVLKRLDELCILDRVTYISAVSGGAVTGGVYVYLKRQKGDEFELSQLEEELLQSVKKNPRTRRLPWTFLLRLAVWLLPLRAWMPFERWLSFDRFFDDEFFRGNNLDYLDPARRPPQSSKFPRLVLNTTSLEIGQDFYFTPTYIGPRADAALGLNRDPSRISPQGFSIARGVGASACVPVVFAPYAVSGVRPEPDPADDDTGRTGIKLGKTHLVDGGVYDNQGIAIFLTPFRGGSENVQYLIASDASKTLSPSETPLPTWREPFKHLTLALRLVLRAHSITEDRARWERYDLLLYKLKVQHLRQAAFFHTRTDTQEGVPYRLPQEMTDGLARLRTDFDSFSDLEIAALMYHGYTLVNHRIFNYCRDLLPDVTQTALHAICPEQIGAGSHGQVTWQALVKALGGNPPGITPLRTWPSFVSEVRKSLPRRGWTYRCVGPWLEKPWRPFLDEDDPTRSKNEQAKQAAISHIKRGATQSLVLRGLQRLADRLLGWPKGILKPTI